MKKITITKDKFKKSLIAVAFNLPTIPLMVVGFILIAKPEWILTGIHYGWIIAIYVVSFLALVITAGIFVGKTDSTNPSFAFVKQCSAIMIEGAFVFIILMGLGLGCIPKTYSLTFADAQEANIELKKLSSYCSNIPLEYIEVEFTLSDEFHPSEGLQIEDGYLAGLGTCTDKYIFIDKPVQDFAFNEKRVLDDKVLFLLDGCDSVGNQAFRLCGNLYDVYFLQKSRPALGWYIFSYTWDREEFHVHVPDALYEEYKNYDEESWQKYLVGGRRLSSFEGYIVTLKLRHS